MPTQSEFRELLGDATPSWLWLDADEAVGGMRWTSLTCTAACVFPGAGYWNGKPSYNVGRWLNYYAGSIWPYDPSDAWLLYGGSPDRVDLAGASRNTACSVRGVLGPYP